MNIIEFLEARVAEDDAAATRHQADASARGFGDYPTRVLAECRAKRYILELYRSYERLEGPGAAEGLRALGMVLQDLVSVYSSHPDYPLKGTLRGSVV